MFQENFSYIDVDLLDKRGYNTGIHTMDIFTRRVYNCADKEGTTLKVSSQCQFKYLLSKLSRSSFTYIMILSELSQL